MKDIKAYIYKSFSDAGETVLCETGKTLRENFSDMDFNTSVCFLNGKKADPDSVIHSDMTVMIRQLPQGSFNEGMATINDWFNSWGNGDLAWLGQLVLNLVVPFGFLVPAFANQYYQQKAADEAAKLEKLSNNSSITNLPFLRGASNSVATNKNQPMILGRHNFAPYKLAPQFFEISGTNGEDEYVYEALECGFAPLQLRSIIAEDVVLKATNTVAGTGNLNPGSVFKDGVYEFQNDGYFRTLTEANIRHASTVSGKEIPRQTEIDEEEKDEVIFTLDSYAKDVELCVYFPNGFYAYNDDNDKIKTSIVLTPKYSLDGGTTWIDITDGFNQNGIYSNTFSFLEEKKQRRYCCKHSFSFSDWKTLQNNGQSAIQIKIHNSGEKSSKIQNTVGLYFYQSKCFDPNKSIASGAFVNCLIIEERERTYSAVLGLKLHASITNQEKLDKINVVAVAGVRLWNRSEWSNDLQFDTVENADNNTSNPAAIALTLMTWDKHPLSKFNDDEIDMDSFGALFEHCENNNFFYDSVITQSAQKEEIISNVLNACHATLYKNMYGKWACAWDGINDTAIALFTAQNIVKITNSKTFGRKTDAIRVKYITNADNLYDYDTMIILADGSIADSSSLTMDSVIRDITLNGITNPQQAEEAAYYAMACEKYRPKKISLEIGPEGIYYTPYSKILLQTDSLKTGLGNGVIKSVATYGGRITSLTFSNPITFPTESAIGFIINHPSTTGSNLVYVTNTSLAGTTTDKIDVSLEADSVTPGDTFAWGLLDTNGKFTKVVSQYVITGIKRSANSYTLDCVDYNAEIFNNSSIGEYHPNITQKTEVKQEQISKDYATKDEVIDEVSSETSILQDSANAVAELVTNGVTFRSVHKINKANVDNLTNGINLENLQQKLDEIRKECSDGISISEDKITIGVSDKEKNIFSMIELTKESILQVVSNGDEELSSSITQTAKDIRSEVSDIKTGLESTIEQSATDIIAQVDDIKNELTGLIDVQAGAVQALVEGGGATGRMALSLELPVLIDSTTREKFITASSEAKVNAVYAKLESDNTKYAIKANATDTQVKALWDDAVKEGLLASRIKLTADQIKVAVESLDIDAKKVVVKSGETSSTIIEDGKIRTALIDVEEIFSKEITLKSGGVIKSEIFNETQGFKLSADGVFECLNGIFSSVKVNENSIFYGDIYSGPLELNFQNPVEESTPHTFLKGEDTTSFFSFINNLTQFGVFTFNEIEISSFEKYYEYITPDGWNGPPLALTKHRFFDKRGNIVVTMCSSPKTYKTTVMPYDAVINDTYKEGWKTFKLKDLPSVEPVVQNVVWVDTDGFLRIKK